VRQIENRHTGTQIGLIGCLRGRPAAERLLQLASQFVRLAASRRQTNESTSAPVPLSLSTASRLPLHRETILLPLLCLPLFGPTLWPG